jgi:hypothetical protein
MKAQLVASRRPDGAEVHNVCAQIAAQLVASRRPDGVDVRNDASELRRS